MSNAHNEHDSVIKTPKQLIAAVTAAFVIPIICIVLLVQYVANIEKEGAGSDAQTAEAIAARLKPVADVGFTLKDANAPKVLQSGEAVYKAVCAACHTAGVAGAPKLGDAAGWTARLGQGQEMVVQNAIKGIRAMPAKGGNPDLDDVEVERAVVYLANQSGGKLKEPAVKEAAPAAAPAATDAGAPTASATQPTTSSPSQQTQALAAAAGAATGAAKVDGKKVYAASCAACHDPGVAGAPKLGDKAAWAPRIKQGSATMYEHAIKGFQGKAGMMPPKGGSAASDDEVKAAVDYMADASK
ncbi:c-type cytochrome [Noviherbaspirillum saxi]|uniref:Cytochrome c5 family protein n=1 Tax=Noviherbaspirillum saxi TaxID=2320863 RepID=A0A3A3FNX7_9BURK|nr:c-type cytochrome [Noviherbaspirillum saxi]RJF97160.1 cytochrome c5 family protein [Noviherbaspirillum saxi]